MIYKICSIFLTLLLFLLFGCNKADETPNINQKLQQATAIETAVSVRQFAKSNEQLDVRIDLKDPEFVKSLSDMEIAKLKAAVYRFYKTVHAKNGNYYTPLNNGEEINISTDLFKVFRNDLLHMNQNINKLKKEGKDIEMQEISSKYLSSLLE